MGQPNFSVSSIKQALGLLNSKLADDDRLKIDVDEIRRIVHAQGQFFTTVKDLMRTAKEVIKIGFTQNDVETVEYFFSPDCFVYKDENGKYIRITDYNSIASAFRHMNPLKTDKDPTFSDFINGQVELLVERIAKKCQNSTPYFGEVPASPESEV